MVCFYLHLALVLMGMWFNRGLRPQPGSTSQQGELKTFHSRLNVKKAHGSFDPLPHHRPLESLSRMH